jgi:hypothetical protein
LALAQAECTKNDSCSLNGFYNDRLYGSEAACERRLQVPCVSELMATGTHETVTTVSTCASSIAGVACGVYFDLSNPQCSAPVGTRAIGNACGSHAQCATGFCSIQPNGICGTCADTPAPGSACAPGSFCGDDATCAVPAGQAMGTCANYVASGGKCLTGTLPCGIGLACVGENVATSTKGVCTAKGATVGAACDTTAKTMPDCAFVLGLTCIPTAPSTTLGKCAPIALAAPGATCGIVGNPVTSVVDCQAGGLCVNGKCVGTTTIGSSCDTVKGPPCLAPVLCVPTTAGGTAGTCTEPDATTCN